MGKLWEKGYSLNAFVEKFTVEKDIVLDKELIAADAAASIAHLRMLTSIGIISTDDSVHLQAELQRIAKDGAAGMIEIQQSDEDCHTVIENRLIQVCGSAGERVHTGRSRNDQVAAALRLYTREALLIIIKDICQMVSILLRRAEEEKDTLMPGRTHLQRAMLSSFGLWFGSWAEQLLDDMEFLLTAARLNNRSPLGSAAGYGVPLPLNREMVAEELGFACVQNNVLAVQHSRGSIEARVVEALAAVTSTIGRAAQDLLFFSLPEFGYVHLPEQMCSGSSIMPQKRNPDVLELLRSRAARMCGWASQCRDIIRNLPSGYNRDLQDTKEPLMRALHTAADIITAGILLMRELKPQKDVMRHALTSDLFAVDYALQLVTDHSIPFREAYRQAAKKYTANTSHDLQKSNTIAEEDMSCINLHEAVQKRSSTGMIGHLHTAVAQSRVRSIMQQVETQEKIHSRAVRRLLGTQKAKDDIPLWVHSYR